MTTETNLYYYRARYYDPTIGRFLSEDSARFDESANFYPYAKNIPSTHNDPFGHGLPDCAAEIARLLELEARLADRLAERAAASCKDYGHQKAIDQLQRAIDKQKERVARHCTDAEIKKQLLLLGLIAAATALAFVSGGGSVGWAWGAAVAY